MTDEIVYLAADEEEDHYVAQANAQLDDEGHFVDERVPCRYRDQFPEARPSQIEYMDVTPKQVVSVATALIPFLEHDDANRALMGSNMQRQAVPLLEPEAPIVGTGMEERAARDSGQVVVAAAPGVVTSVTADRIQVERDSGELDEYRLRKFVRSNQGTCINQRPIVDVGARVEAGEVLADSSSTDHGELALGRNVLVAFMRWEGGNYEDAIVISERLVREDIFTSIHIEKHEVEARDTKLGPEEITRDIPNVGEESPQGPRRGRHHLHRRRGAAGRHPGRQDHPEGRDRADRRGATAARDLRREGPRGEGHLPAPAARRARQGRRRPGSSAASSGDELLPGVNRLVRVAIAQKRKISVGDKMAGRHGNKGVVARILPMEDMPFLPDGTPVDIILNPLGVPSRMNIGQILETHLGWALHDARPDGRHAGLRRGRRGADPRRAARTPACRERQDRAARRPHRRGVRPADHRRLHLHAQAPPPGGGQDPRPVHRPVLA